MKSASQRPESSARTLFVDDGLVVAELGRICVAIWRGAVTWPRFDKQRWGLVEVVQRHPRGAGFLCVVETSASPPDDRLRRASIEMFEEHGDRVRCIAVAIEGAGFRAAINRGVLSGMALLRSNKDAPARAFSTVVDALEWMAQRIPIEPGAPTLVEEIRSSLGPPATGDRHV